MGFSGGNFVFVAVVNFLLVPAIVLGSDWTYDDTKHWSSLCQIGKHQSPIALHRSIATQKEFSPLILKGYGNLVTAMLKNNGHSAEVRPQTPQGKPEISGGGLQGVYQLDHLHFHWQSEHTMENYRFPLELHLVHFAKEYGNLTNAIPHRHGVAVFGVLFDLSPDDDEDFVPLLHLVQTLQGKVNEPKQLSDFIVKNFLPRNLAGFYRYDGSLTTPGCNEEILWTVFTSTIPISKSQVKIFEEIQTAEKSVLKKNYRPLQELNGRTVYLKVSPIRSGSARSSPLFYLMVLAVSFLFVFKR